MCELVIKTSYISTIWSCGINMWLVKSLYIMTRGAYLISILKDAISCISNCQTQICSGSSNTAIKIWLVGKKWSDKRLLGECRNCWVFLLSSTFYNSMASSDFLPAVRNCLLEENWVIPTSITSNSVLDFGALFSTSHNLTRIKDLSSLIEVILPYQQPYWMKTKFSPLILNCSLSLSISQMAALLLYLSRICVPLGLKQVYSGNKCINGPKIRCPVSESQT